MVGLGVLRGHGWRCKWCCGNQQKYGFGWRGLKKGFHDWGFYWTVDWGLKQLGRGLERFSNKRSPISWWVLFPNLQYTNINPCCFFFPTSVAKKTVNQLRFHIYPRAFNSYVAAKDASPADWHDKLANFNLVARVFIVNAIRTSGFWNKFLNKSTVKGSTKGRGGKKKQHKREREDRYPCYIILSMFSKDPLDPPMEGWTNLYN